jgi:hypothetical protein
MDGSCTYGSAAVSSVDKPAPTTNMLPQKPPKDRLTPDGQKRRHPTVRTERPTQLALEIHSSRLEYEPVINVTRNPYFLKIQPEIVNGQMK